MPNDNPTQTTDRAGHVCSTAELGVLRQCNVPPELRVPLRELVALKIELARDMERRKVPPCLECGAETPEQAETMCRCGGDKDDCHGVNLWPYA